MKIAQSAADVTATMSSITHYLGLRNVQVDVTFTTLTTTYDAGLDEPNIIMRRQVTHRENDYADLTAVDHLVSDLLTDEIDRDDAAARRRSRGTVRAPPAPMPPRPRTARPATVDGREPASPRGDGHRAGT